MTPEEVLMTFALALFCASYPFILMAWRMRK